MCVCVCVCVCVYVCMYHLRNTPIRTLYYETEILR